MDLIRITLNYYFIFFLNARYVFSCVSNRRVVFFFRENLECWMYIYFFFHVCVVSDFYGVTRYCRHVQRSLARTLWRVAEVSMKQHDAARVGKTRPHPPWNHQPAVASGRVGRLLHCARCPKPSRPYPPALAAQPIVWPVLPQSQMNRRRRSCCCCQRRRCFY